MAKKKPVDPEAAVARAYKLLGGDGREERRTVGRAISKLGPADFAAVVHILSSIGFSREACRRILRSADARAWLAPQRKRVRYRGPGLFDEIEAAAGLTPRRPRPLRPSGSRTPPNPAAPPGPRRSELRPARAMPGPGPGPRGKGVSG